MECVCFNFMSGNMLRVLIEYFDCGIKDNQDKKSKQTKKAALGEQLET